MYLILSCLLLMCADCADCVDKENFCAIYSVSTSLENVTRGFRLNCHISPTDEMWLNYDRTSIAVFLIDPTASTLNSLFLLNP